ncbi:MAG: response regulator [Planctomycetota bacterium]
MKFTASGEVRLQARTDDPFAEPVTVVVEVVDTGIGMDSSELLRLFQPFQQANVETTRRYGGTGLGLCISRGLAEGMGGSLTAASEPGRGSTFTLVLPLARADAPRQREHKTAGQSNADAARLRGLRVLVAEDNPNNQRLLTAMLKRAGCIVIAATDGRAAVERHRDSAPDLILMDCRMPVLDGVEATRAIRAAEQGRRRTPIVALSADSMLFERDRCLEAGMDEFCEKPIDGKGLLEVLRRHTAKSD